jgi:regulator of sigma E protease
MFWLTLLAFLVILGLLVFVHEAGHFLAAKLSGVKVEEFAFGFPPKIFCVKHGETKYCINAIPFGGYVKMLGEEKQSDSPRAFNKKKPSIRLIILVAGVVMNFLLAGVVFSVGYMVGMSPIRVNPEEMGGRQSHQVIIAQIEEGSAAAKSNLKVGDVVLGYDNIDAFGNFTRSNAGKNVDLSVLREGQITDLTIQLSEDQSAPLGVGIVDVPFVKLTFFKAIYFGFKEMFLTTGYIFILLYGFFVRLFSSGNVAGEVSGPVGIFNITGQAVRMGLSYLMQLTAILSINLGLINILPFPALDGGRAILVVLEGVVRRKIIRAEVENMLHFIGFIILILLVAAVTIREVIALF